VPAGCSLSTAFVPVGVSVSVSVSASRSDDSPGSTVVWQPVASLASAKPSWTVQLDVPGPGPIGDKQRFLLASSKNWDMVVAATPWVRP
jgi:hypothetical protein